MKFRTEYVAQKAPFALRPEKPVVLLGSCFADNIASRMRATLWEAENPLGTLYNPLSISAALDALLLPVAGEVDSPGEPDTSDKNLQAPAAESLMFEDSLFEANGTWRSWLYDSRLSAETSTDVVFAFSEMQTRLHSLLSRAEALFITFGTSWCYYLNDESRSSGRLVANCHKQPASLFTRRRLSVDEIVEVWTRQIHRLRLRWPELKIIFTVSPVRHLKDGFEGNARSKAILLLATERLCAMTDNCYYFPAYEIVTDDLRDYRFYASDLVHPSEEAVEYIWDLFKRIYLDEPGLCRLKEGENIRKGLDHRPLPNATRQPSPESLARESARIVALEQRKARFKASRL